MAWSGPGLGLKDFDSPGDTSGTEEDTDSAVLYGTLRGSVVGLRYYTGVVNNNEMVALQREPNNPYDKNAVKVNNVNGDQLKGEFDKLFEDLKEDDKTSEMEAVEAVGTLLLPHQKQALRWMVSRENSHDLPPFWEERSNFYYNTLTNFAEQKQPKNVLGGILADDMGLGKTLTTIALILTNFEDGKPLPVEKITSDKFYEASARPRFSRPKGCDIDQKGQASPDLSNQRDSSNVMELDVSNVEKFGTTPLKYSSCPPTRNQAKKPRYLGSSDLDESEQGLLQRTEGTACVQSVEKKYSDDGPRATLIVCPLSVLSNWIDQFGQHIRRDFNVKIYVYYGSDRSKDASVLSEQDIVLTTYNVLATDYGIKGDSPLHKVKWLRIVLDEGHTIRNPNAQQTKAALNLEGHRRWILTGTPIQNSVKDLWSLISFLKLKPFTDREWWYRTIQRPVTMGDPEGLRRLRSLMRSITLRRCKTSQVKGKPILELPERKVLIQYVTLTEEERQIYQSVKNEGKATISRNKLQVEHLVECPLEEKIDSSSGKKPDQEWISSSKINALMHALIKLRRDNPAAKCLVVSQFTTFLSLIENPLKESGFAFTRLDGSMAQKKRVEAIQCFQSNQAGSPTIMLLSLKAGGVGLNLTAASRVFLMDPFIVKDSVEENILNIQNKKRELAAGAFATKKPSASEVKQNKMNEIKALIDL
ncbi:helicase-like transcription factor [Willisornis vidua]|uniref:Helicase-like transcription factor n=1 Tax=Willisornis vidua TaxID=1566151 RepID=A0ABQ9DK75_9PASS|nr:helicase-like transcription factor [Willisornis vidua]